MSYLLQRLFGRLPIGWLQLTHNRTRFAAALAELAALALPPADGCAHERGQRA